MLAVVQHHPDRFDLLPRLHAGLAGFDVEIVESEQLNPPSPWHTYRRCLEVACENACRHDHAVIIQDDAIVCDRFKEELERSIDAHPTAVLALFLASQPVDTAIPARHARMRGDRFVALTLRAQRTWMPVVAVSYPMGAIADVLDWIDDYPGTHRRSDDHMMGQWAVSAAGRIRVLCTVPSLVQHPDDTPSVIGNGAGAAGKNPARSALFFPP